MQNSNLHIKCSSTQEITYFKGDLIKIKPPQRFQTKLSIIFSGFYQQNEKKKSSQRILCIHDCRMSMQKYPYIQIKYFKPYQKIFLCFVYRVLKDSFQQIYFVNIDFKMLKTSNFLKNLFFLIQRKKRKNLKKQLKKKGYIYNFSYKKEKKSLNPFSTHKICPKQFTQLIKQLQYDYQLAKFLRTHRAQQFSSVKPNKKKLIFLKVFQFLEKINSIKNIKKNIIQAFSQNIFFEPQKNKTLFQHKYNFTSKTKKFTF
eukprot:TRINITY_DN4103_c0_g2_i3.p1 TRINITY_DN4103_c0_g2~~TRINITY_DN4103_c0_g2_i3.p1  ORF type:complete len:257 (+),score=3.67 TRINITY_DN4103_c0_g2_i3:235-1005(+)